MITIPYIGNGKIDEQTESGEIRVGCQTVNTICKKPFEYTSYITDTTAQTDYLKYNQYFSALTVLLPILSD